MILDELGLQWDANREWRLLPNGERFTVIMDTNGPVMGFTSWRWSSGKRSDATSSAGNA